MAEELEYPEELNEQTWDQCQSLWVFGDFFDPYREFCPTPPPNRKFRFMIVAALRAIWNHIPDPRSRAAVEAAERYADDPSATPSADIESAAEEATREASTRYPDQEHAHLVAWMAWRSTEEGPNDGTRPTPWVEVVNFIETEDIPGRTREQARTQHLHFFRDIFSNPFRPVAFDPAWRTDTAIAIARGMYESRDFSPMPILADALQDAGCDNDDILNHCRDANGVHVRGCWVVDLVLGKE